MKAGAGSGAGVLSGSVALGPHSALKDRQRMPSFSSENARADAESGLPLQPQPHAPVADNRSTGPTDACSARYRCGLGRGRRRQSATESRLLTGLQRHSSGKFL